MPFISTKTNTRITAEKEKIIKEKLGRAISLIGKTESWLMLDFEDDRRMYFKGSAEKPTAFIEIKLFGRASASQYDKMTAEVTDIIGSELGISPDCIYVKYEEADHWGWNANNF